MKSLTRFLLPLLLLASVPVLRADELDDLALPPLPGEGDELDLPPLPGDKPATPAPKPPPPPPPASSKSSEDLDLPPLPGEEVSPTPKPSKESSDPLEGLDLPDLPGEKTKSEPAPKEPEALDLPGLPDEEATKTPAPKVKKKEEPVEEYIEAPSRPVELPARLSEGPVTRGPKVSHHVKRTWGKAKPAAPKEAPRRPAVPGQPPRPPLPGMNFWSAGLVGPLAPQGGKAALAYALAGLILPWNGWSRLLSFLRSRFKKS